MDVDPKNRDRLIKSIDGYLSGTLTSFQFDEKIGGIAASSGDPVVLAVRDELWCLYDDIVDHKVVLSKVEWDYVQRLKLLLRSNAQIEANIRRIWSVTQLVAAVALLLFATCVAWLGAGSHLIALFVAMAIVSNLICLAQRRSQPIPSRLEIALTPFTSVSQLLKVRRRVADFAKQKYPSHLESARIRTPGIERLVSLISLAVRILYSPLELAFQLFPETHTKFRLVTS